MLRTDLMERADDGRLEQAPHVFNRVGAAVATVSVGTTVAEPAYPSTSEPHVPEVPVPTAGQTDPDGSPVLLTGP